MDAPAHAQLMLDRGWGVVILNRRDEGVFLYAFDWRPVADVLASEDAEVRAEGLARISVAVGETLDAASA